MTRVFASILLVACALCLCFPGSVAAGSLEETLSTSALTEAQLKGKTPAELDILRNHIYARHGYIFKRGDLKQYFSEFGWYKPEISDSAAIEKKLNATEKQNIALLKKLESQKPSDSSAGKTGSSPATCGEFIDNESNIRSEPAVKAKLLGVSKTGERFDVLDSKDPWYYIKTTGGITGWTHKKNIKLSLCRPASTEGVETPNTPDEAGPPND
ncbi:MAG TPA: YARHG domain-containing protein, partial [Candidatus Ozemobacteraceae bacterium]|nr:YARHG domain-containing protein [Candidatus Ozemobacteraceae bacterium]